MSYAAVRRAQYDPSAKFGSLRETQGSLRIPGTASSQNSVSAPFTGSNPPPSPGATPTARTRSPVRSPQAYAQSSSLKAPVAGNSLTAPPAGSLTASLQGLSLTHRDGPQRSRSAA